MTQRYPSVPGIDTIRQCCWQEQAVTIRYADKQAAVTDRTIWPLAIVYLDRKLVVLAWCCLREGFRIFQADRISAVEMAGDSFRPKRVSLLRMYLAELQGQRDADQGAVG
jgi:predicted DNA-binding transcriptional regulator YafY